MLQALISWAGCISPIIAFCVKQPSDECLNELRNTGVSILLIEQNAKAALRIASRGYVMEAGRIIMEGKASDLLEDPHVVSAYLGG